MRSKYIILILILFIGTQLVSEAQQLAKIGEGWGNNSVNVAVFRKNSLVSLGDIQYAAYYNQEGYVILGMRKLGEEWKTVQTQYKGNVNDAHNVISIMIDGDGYLHMSWDHHGHPLRYARSKEPFSMEMGDKEPMTGLLETSLTYPEFYRLPSGDLIFMYRDGSSGKGDLIMNKYDLKTRKWRQVQHNLISGEGQRNAYCQAYIDNSGIIHLSWVWRESWLVETNHDMCYARSKDEGKSWENSKDDKYRLPITAATAEIAYSIPQNSELINQTSMTSDHLGRPYIATYWRDENSDIPQFRIIYHDGKEWNMTNIGNRKTPFTLRGGGTKRIPISRPQIVTLGKKDETRVYLFFRDEERNSKISVAVSENIKEGHWETLDLSNFPVGSWEPTFDTELWKDKGLLHLFVQNAEQIDGEGKANIQPQPIYVLELNNNNNIETW